jgi:hypothetical protein
MLSWIVQITIISIVLIFLVHHLINFFKSTLTVPKIKDLVNVPTQKYENMYNIINNQKMYKNENVNVNKNVNENVDNEYTLIDLLPKEKEKGKGDSMKSELKNFLKSQFTNSKTTENNNIYALDSISNTSSYSNY